MKKIILFLDKVIKKISNFVYYLTVMKWKKIMCMSCGKNVKIGKYTTGYWNNVNMGNNISIGRNNCFINYKAIIHIGNHVMTSPNVTIVTGSHRMDVIGKYMDQIDHEHKSPENDRDIIIEDDVWICSNSTILKGVRIGKGSVVSAGSVVTRDVEPYTIVGGVPAKLIRYRFTKEEIKDHEKLLERN